MTWKSGRYEDEWLTMVSFCPYLFHSLFSLLVFLSLSLSLPIAISLFVFRIYRTISLTFSRRKLDHLQTVTSIIPARPTVSTCSDLKARS